MCEHQRCVWDLSCSLGGSAMGDGYDLVYRNGCIATLQFAALYRFLIFICKVNQFYLIPKGSETNWGLCSWSCCAWCERLCWWCLGTIRDVLNSNLAVTMFDVWFAIHLMRLNYFHLIIWIFNQVNYLKTDAVSFTKFYLGNLAWVTGI